MGIFSIRYFSHQDASQILRSELDPSIHPSVEGRSVEITFRQRPALGGIQNLSESIHRDLKLQDLRSQAWHLTMSIYIYRPGRACRKEVGSYTILTNLWLSQFSFPRGYSPGIRHHAYMDTHMASKFYKSTDSPLLNIGAGQSTGRNRLTTFTIIFNVPRNIWTA